MNEIIIIASSDSTRAKSLSEQVTGSSDDFVILQAESVEVLQNFYREYGCSLLLIDLLLYKQFIADAIPPKDTAFLVQATDDQADEYLQQTFPENRNCDFIPKQLSPVLLRHKINLLLQYRTLRQKHINLQEEFSKLTAQLEEKEQALNLQHHYLDILTERDGLTGLYNRKHLTTVLNKEFQSARSSGREFSLLLLDIDHFKNINRKHGHLYGDFVLNEIAARLTSNTRSSDLCFRFGGGNFIVLLPNINLQNSCSAAKKLKECCDAKKFNDGEGSHQITISIGVASLIESSPETADQLIHMADKAMCQAKAEGRNRVKTYPYEDQQ